MLEFDDQAQGPKIKVIGVGGGGGNALNTMIEAGIQGVDFVAANTDCQVLETNQAPTKIQIGKNLTKGLGAGANPDIGCAAALEDASRIAEVIGGADMVFVTAGMGGGTGTGAAPVIARVAREAGALTVAVVTKPFMFEGLQRKKKANAGVAELAKSVDALIVIPNDRLVTLAGKNMTLRESFNLVDSVCATAVRGISDLVMMPGLINVDFADVRTIMTGMGRALMGSGHGKGEKRALDAAHMAINSPLLEDVSINGATGILVNITGGPDLMLAEVTEACTLIQEAADPDANIIFGSVIDANMTDEVRLTVIATGFQSRTAVESSTVAGTLNTRSGKKPTDHQMVLPISHPAPATHPAPPRVSLAVTAAPPPVPALARAPIADSRPAGSQYIAIAAPACSAVPEIVEFADTVVDEFSAPVGYPSGATTYTPPPVVGVATAPSAPVAITERLTPAPEARPVIRPAVTSAMSAVPVSGPRRVSGTVPVALAADHLCIEESEFDKPTYLRRAMAGETPLAMRLPGEGSKL
jgi:cell division protein FtsZ